MNSEAQITLAIPYHANLSYLKKAVESVRGQTAENWVLVVSDDSPATRPEVAAETEAYLKSISDPRIRYFRNLKSTGMASNWNQCLELADTDLVTLLHADDELSPQYCEKVIEAGQKYPEPVAFFTAAQVIDEESRPKFSFPDRYKDFLLSGSGPVLEIEGESGVHRLLRGNIIFCPSLCFRKSRLQSERFRLDLKQVTDLEIILRLLLQGQQFIGLMNEPLYLYRRHGSNATVTHTQSLLRFEEEDTLYRQMELTCTERQWSKAHSLAKKRTIIQLNLIYCMVQDFLHFEWRSLGRKWNFLMHVRSSG